MKFMLSRYKRKAYKLPIHIQLPFLSYNVRYDVTFPWLYLLCKFDLHARQSKAYGCTASYVQIYLQITMINYIHTYRLMKY